jgi:H+/Cl- antiporter ClcA
VEKLLPILLKVFVLCGFVAGLAGMYQQAMFNAAWRRDQYDKGLSVWSIRAGFALFSTNLSAECRMRRRKYALAVLVFLVFLGLGMVTLKAGYQLGIFPEQQPMP